MISYARFQSLDATTIPGLVADYSVDGFPEYATQLDHDQRLIVKQVASRIIHSFITDLPVRAVMVVGNCDVALKKPAGSQRTAFEQEVSDARAAIGEQVLLEEVVKVGGPNAPGCFLTSAIGIGSANRTVLHPVNESQMRKNRRVDFVLFNDSLHRPRCAA